MEADGEKSVQLDASFPGKDKSDLLALEPVEIQEHRRVLGHTCDEPRERAETGPAEHVVLPDHQALRADGLVRGRKPVVPDERHALDEGPRRSHHAVEPPDVVVAPRVVRRERAALLVFRRRADELLRPGMRQRMDGAVEPELRERVGLALARAEAGTPKQPLSLSGSERARVLRDP